MLAQTSLRSAFPEADSEIKIICTSEFNDMLLGETSELVRNKAIDGGISGPACGERLQPDPTVMSGL